ncbi:MAG: hypothetical protein N2560_02980 [Ignavibacteria bacterium]|nr:hypothetical protein [Ignavibacteria bacterium]
MKKFIIPLLLIGLLFVSCELIRLTEKKKTEIKPDPKNSIGTIFFFIDEVKKDNLQGVDKLFIVSDTTFTAENLFELQDKIQRFSRSVSNRQITSYNIDTLNNSEHLIFVEFDYLYKYFFITQKKDDIWLIRNFGEKK